MNSRSFATKWSGKIHHQMTTSNYKHLHERLNQNYDLPRKILQQSNKASPWPINPITNSSHPSYPPLQAWGTTGYRDQLIHIPHPSFLYRYKCKGLLIVATWINHYIYVWLHIQIFCLYTSMVTSMQVKILKKSAGHAHKNIRRTWTGFTANANKLFRLICTIICILETKTIM